MNQTFLQAIGSVLTNGLKATVELHGIGEGKIKLVYTPDIGPIPEKASDSEVKLRAAIAKPMVVSGTPLEIEEAFKGLIDTKAAVVGRGLSALDEMERLASAAVAAAKGAATATAAPAQPTPSDDDDGGDDTQPGEEGDAGRAQAVQPAPAVQPVIAQTLGEGF